MTSRMTFPFRREGAALFCLINFFSPDFPHDAYARVAPFPQRAAAAFRAHSRGAALPKSVLRIAGAGSRVSSRIGHLRPAIVWYGTKGDHLPSDSFGGPGVQFTMSVVPVRKRCISVAPCALYRSTFKLALYFAY